MGTGFTKTASVITQPFCNLLWTLETCFVVVNGLFALNWDVLSLPCFMVSWVRTYSLGTNAARGVQKTFLWILFLFLGLEFQFFNNKEILTLNRETKRQQ